MKLLFVLLLAVAACDAYSTVQYDVVGLPVGWVATPSTTSVHVQKFDPAFGTLAAVYTYIKTNNTANMTAYTPYAPSWYGDVLTAFTTNFNHSAVATKIETPVVLLPPGETYAPGPMYKVTVTGKTLTNTSIPLIPLARFVGTDCYEFLLKSTATTGSITINSQGNGRVSANGRAVEVLQMYVKYWYTPI